MNDKCREALEHFANRPNWGCPHPLDWQKFFRFIAIARRMPKSRPSADEVEDFLLKKHKVVENVRRFVYFYDHALDMLEHLRASIPIDQSAKYERRGKIPGPPLERS